MTNEERDLIAQFVARVGGAAGGGFARSVPATQPSLPPIDPEADRFIADQFQSHPDARYRITQMAVVQEAALAEAANRIQRLQAELQAAQQSAQRSAPQSGQAGGFFSNLFGGGQAARPAPGPQVWNQGPPAGASPQYTQYGAASAAVPPPQYPPNMQPGMFGQSGSGFLGSALRTAAGVAGGVVAGNVLMDMFSGHHGGGMFGGGMEGAYGMPGPTEETIVNNYGDTGQGQGDPGWDNNVQGDAGGFDSGGSWDDNSGGGGFDSGGGSGGGFDDNSI